MNETLKTAAKNILKDLLHQCTEKEQHMFKRMYGHGNLELSIDEVVDKINEEKIDWAITQCENTLKKRKNDDI